MAKYKTERGRTVCSIWNFALWARALHSCLLLLPVLLSLHMTTKRWRVRSIWNLSLEARALSSCLLLFTHTLSLFILFFLFSVSLYCFLGFEAQQDTRVTNSLAPPSKVHWQRARRSCTCTLSYWVWNPGSVCDPTRACQWAINPGVSVSTVEILTLYSHKEVFHSSFAFFYSFSLC